jgi:hypothetical protein
MHYRTERIGFLEPLDPFLELMPGARILQEPAFDTADLPATGGPLVVVPSAP